MPRYFDTATKREAPLPNANTVILPDEHPFWQPTPPGNKVTFDAEGIPNGYEPISIPVDGSDEAIYESLGDANVTTKKITLGMFRHQQTGNSTTSDKMANRIQTIAAHHNVSVDYVIQLLAEEDE